MKLALKAFILGTLLLILVTLSPASFTSVNSSPTLIGTPISDPISMGIAKIVFQDLTQVTTPLSNPLLVPQTSTVTGWISLTFNSTKITGIAYMNVKNYTITTLDIKNGNANGYYSMPFYTVKQEKLQFYTTIRIDQKLPVQAIITGEFRIVTPPPLPVGTVEKAIIYPQEIALQKLAIQTFGETFMFIHPNDSLIYQVNLTASIKNFEVKLRNKIYQDNSTGQITRIVVSGTQTSAPLKILLKAPANTNSLVLQGTVKIQTIQESPDQQQSKSFISLAFATAFFIIPLMLRHYGYKKELQTR